MKKFVRVLAFLLCMFMMLGVLTACSNDGSADASSKSSSKKTSSVVSNTQSGDVSQDESSDSSEDASQEGSSSVGGNSSTGSSSKPNSSTGTSSKPNSSTGTSSTPVSTTPKADEIVYRASSANKQVKSLKILPVGDSLTNGSGTLSGWRYEAYKQFYTSGITFEFVGPYTSSWDHRLSDRYNKHAGENGRKIQTVINYADEIFKRDFDVVLLMIGYNDNGNLGDDTKALYRSLVDKIYTYNSKATVICMGIAPDYHGGDKFDDFNKYIGDMCADMKKAGRETYYASMASDKWNSETCFTDSVHFNETGNAIVAENLAKVAVPILKKLNVTDTSYKVPASPSSISLDKSSITLTAYNGFSQGAQLKATVNPSNAEVKNVLWASSDRNIATVDANGVVRAVSAGKCTITGYTLDGGKKATCSVTVKADKAGTVLFSEGFESHTNWSGSSSLRQNIKRNMYFCQKVAKTDAIATKSSFNAGKKFYFSMDARICRYNAELPAIKDKGYASISYGNLELREDKNGNKISVLCNGNTVCEYNNGTFTVDVVEYGLFYDNGKVSIMRNGIEVATGNATANLSDGTIKIVSYEYQAIATYDNVKLVKF